MAEKKVTSPLVRDLGTKLSEDVMASVKRTCSLCDDPTVASEVLVFALNAIFAASTSLTLAINGLEPNHRNVREQSGELIRLLKRVHSL